MSDQGNGDALHQLPLQELTYQTFKRYDGEEYITKFNPDSNKWLGLMLDSFKQITSQNPRIFVANPGTFYSVDYARYYRDMFVPTFIKLTQGKPYRPEGIVNQIFTTLNCIQNAKGFLILDSNNPDFVQIDVTNPAQYPFNQGYLAGNENFKKLMFPQVLKNLGEEMAQLIYLEPSVRGALIRTLLSDQDPDIMKAVYAVMVYKPLIQNDISVIEARSKRWLGLT